MNPPNDSHPEEIAAELVPVVAALDSVAAAIDRGRDDVRDGVDLNPGLVTLRARAIVGRVDDVFALLRDGTGGTVVGALCRGLLEQAVLVRWVADDATRRLAVVGTLAQERQRIAGLVQAGGLSVPNLMRWLRPYPLDEAALSAIATSGVDRVTGLPGVQQELSKNAGSTVEAITRVPASVAELLAMCGHANYAGSMCTVRPVPHPVGFEVTPEYGALFAQVGGLAAADAARLWRGAADSDLMDDLEARAAAVHRLPRREGLATEPSLRAEERPALLEVPDWWPPTEALEAGLEQVLDRAHDVYVLLQQAPSPFAGDAAVPVNLTAALPYLTGIGTAEVALRAARGYHSGAACATAARMLLEEAARQHWQGQPGDDADLWQRHVAVADGATHGRNLLRTRLKDAGASQAALSALFDVLPDAPPLAIDRRRTPANAKAPKVSRPHEQLGILGQQFAEPRWLELAYSLLSQVVHPSPLGDLHLVGRPPTDARDTCRLSHEMTALAVDCACLGAAVLLPPLAAILAVTLGLDDIRPWRDELTYAAVRVHRAAQLVHFLD